MLRLWIFYTDVYIYDADIFDIYFVNVKSPKKTLDCNLSQLLNTYYRLA